MTIDEQMRIITKGAVEVVNEGDLRAKLEQSSKSGKPLTVKLGLDPSAPDIHLGHTVVLRKIKQLQELGHRAVLIIGDFTGMIGDPTGKSKTRRQLTADEVRANAGTYEAQAARILDPKKTEYRFNSAWLGALDFAGVIRLASKTTVARMLERDDFKKRFVSQQPIGMHELFYPLMQGYDSVELAADIEIGGTDQRFNILFGRDLLSDFGMERQAAIFMPLLEGLDGTEKMSKSLGNYVGIDEPPDSMYGKTMSLPDRLMIRWFELLTDVSPGDIARMGQALASGEANPRDIKMRLAREITAMYRGAEAASDAEERFIRVFQRRELPDAPVEFAVPEGIVLGGAADMPRLLVAAGMTASLSEARRLVAQGGVKVNGDKVMELKMNGLKHRDIVQVGKIKAVRLHLSQ